MSGRPKGREDNPYNQRKPQSESDQQRNARIQKMAQTRKDNNAQKKANKAKRKEEELKKKAEQAKEGFFAPRHQLKKSSLSLQNNTEPKETVPNHGNTDATATAVIDEDVTIDSEEIKITPALDVMFNLDVDEDEVKADDMVDTFDECGVNSDGGGVNKNTLKQCKRELEMK
jgi:seryl-tRNA synthetase